LQQKQILFGYERLIINHSSHSVRSGIIPLENLQLRIVTAAHQDQKSLRLSFTGRSRRHCPTFEIRPATGAGDLVKACKRDRHGRFSQCGHSQFRFAVETPLPVSSSSSASFDHWVQAVQTAITHNPYLEMLLARRRKQI
jgi:hypothetical protein